MPFRTKQMFSPASGLAPAQVVRKTLENGNVETSLDSTCRALPSASMFRLSALLEAGVNLREVNTKVIGGSVSVTVPESSNEVTENEE